MRKSFHQYFRPTEGQLRQLWDDGLFSFDASVLLNIYGYSSETRDSLVDFVQKNAERIRLPHQFGLEYARNRSVVIIKQIKRYQEVEKMLQSVEQNVTSKRDHPYLTAKSLNAFKGIQDELANSRHEIEKLIGTDPYVEKLLSALDARIGPCPNAEDLQALESLAKDRYDKKIPPGFADLKEKGVPEAYGDYIAWHQVMEISKNEQKGIILVTDDLKDDWWLLHSERTIGPRPELMEEFARVTGQQIWMYTSDNFLRAARDLTAAEIGDDAIQEVTERVASLRERLQMLHRKAVANRASKTDDIYVKPSEATLGSSKPDASEAKSTDLMDEPDMEKAEQREEEQNGRKSEV